MSLYILSDKKIKSFLPSKDDREAAAALALNQSRIKTRILKKSDDVYNLSNDPNAMLFITANLSAEYQPIIEYCNNNNIPVICAHEIQNFKADYSYSTIRGNTLQTLKSLLAYSAYYNKTRPAFFALNRFSTHDCRKASIIYDICENFSDSDIYLLDCGFNECFNSFFENRYSYDVIFCSNDFSAIALVEELKLKDPEYLNNVFVVGFMDTILSRLYSPSITTCTYSMKDVTKALLNVYRIYYKSDHISCINILLNTHISTRQSTKNLPINSSEIRQLSGKYKSLGKTLKLNHTVTDTATIVISPIIQICKKIESMLISLKTVDFQILVELLEGNGNSEICDKLFISMQTLQYHLKKMIRSLDVKTKSEFIEIISKYISLENLKNYIKEETP